ncbi:MAG: helix-turn-helix domain-containing protein [Lachnospiraceae bacterium]|nr:helix-turn-helix domain-containing protein [Lachnospiraceae bacterium]
MANYDAGKLIKESRKQKGISQEELAAGLMDRAHLSRIENGTITPNKKTLEPILERLGINPYHTDFFLSEKMTNYQQHIDSLNSYLADQRTGEADSIINRLENDADFSEHKLNQQYLLCAKACNYANENANPEDILALLDKAYKISNEKFGEQKVKEYNCMTSNELFAINLYAAIYFRQNKLEKAIETMLALTYIFDKNCIDKFERGRKYPLLVYNLTKYLNAAKRYDEVIEFCNQGVNTCIETGFLDTLPLILFNKAFCLDALGDKTLSKEYLNQIYITFDMFRLYKHKEIVKECLSGEKNFDTASLPEKTWSK